MPAPWSDGQLGGSLSRLFGLSSLSRSLNQTNQATQTDQVILLRAENWGLAPCSIARMVLRAKIPYHLAPQGEEKFWEEPVQSPEGASIQWEDDYRLVLGDPA